MKKNTEAEDNFQIPSKAAVLPLRDLVVFPHMIVPLFVSRKPSIKAIKSALAKHRNILLLTQKSPETDSPSAKSLYKIGTVAQILRSLNLPDGSLRILIQGVSRARVTKFSGFSPIIEAEVDPVPDQLGKHDRVELEALVRNIKLSLENCINLGKTISPEVMAFASSLEEPGRLADLVASNLDLSITDAQSVLSVTDPFKRLVRVNGFLSKEIHVLLMQQKINVQAKGEIDKIQREFVLRQQLKAIQEELGEGDPVLDEIQHLLRKIRKRKVPKECWEEVERQAKRLERMQPGSAEAVIVQNYLDWIADLPWSKMTRDNLDIRKAARILDEDHFDLEKVKERILEYLSVRKLNRKKKGPILCFVGPPGVGKTSLGKSIARALGRKFVRISLGGVRDEAEIRGHRRTYVGALPGKILQGLQQAGTSNPVFMMDEVDKIGADFRGDPSAALLEVLDPEQNHAFRDNYLALPYDLSQVLFITTANLLEPILPAFRDRMETIELSGYTEEDKLDIAKQFLVPKQVKEQGLNKRQIAFSDGTLGRIISEYTQEAGLRNLEREIAAVCRKVARKVAEGKKGKTLVTASSLRGFLGSPKVFKERKLKQDAVGVATGLAVTETGGSILFLESMVMKGQGRLSLTGQLGDVMKESAQAALSYVRTKAASFKIPASYFDKNDIHLHIPEGATPKDGPSAGLAIVTAILSSCTGKKVCRDTAITGEVTLTGNVLPVGGLKEKILAARRVGIPRVVLPRANKKDMDDIPAKLKRNMTFVDIERIDDIFDIVFRD
jgi:ATP-dependent Lon protease